MEQTLEEHIIADHEKHTEIHLRIDGLKHTTDVLIDEIKGLRDDITPITDVFNTIQIYLRGGKFVSTLVKSFITLIATLAGLTWVSIQIINFFTK